MAYPFSSQEKVSVKREIFEKKKQFFTIFLDFNKIQKICKKL